MRFVGKFLFVCLLICSFLEVSLAQVVIVEGYVFEDNNSGYLNEVSVKAYSDGFQIAETQSNMEGFFTFELPVGKEYSINCSKQGFHTRAEKLNSLGKTNGEKVYAKVGLKRLPGYIFEGAISEFVLSGEADALDSVRIEVYNNTTSEQVLSLDAHPFHRFSVVLEKGNHYTMLFRKYGYFARRIEANVAIDGCILCFEGVGKINPGMSDNLTSGFSTGTLEANIDLRKIEKGRAVRIDNILYDYNQSTIRSDAKLELDKLVNVLRTNPSLEIELRSHTDSRGRAGYNLELSQKRAQAAVDYIISNDIKEERIIAKGYGEKRLINACKDGVNCSEKEHQRNRRTEFAVTGILEGFIDNRSLKEILWDERVVDDGGFGEGQVFQIPAGEDPSKYFSKIEKEKREKNQSGSKNNNALLPSDNELPVKVKFPSDNELPEDPMSGGQSSTDDKKQAKQSVSSSEEGIEIKAKSKEVKERRGAFGEIIGGNKTSSNTGIETKPRIRTKSSIGKVTEETKKANVKKPKIIIKKPNSISKGYTGFKIELEESSLELPYTHKIFSEFGNIEMQRKSTGRYGYYIGEFKNEKSAARFKDKIIGSRYEKSKVIEFSNGRMVF